MEQIKALVNRIDSLSIRERGLILAGVIFMLFTVWDNFFMQVQTIEEKRIIAELQMKQAEQTALNARLQRLLTEDRGDPDEANRQRLAELKSQLEEIETSVEDSAVHLVSPKNMAVILQTILDRSRGLELIGIRGLGASPLLGAAARRQPAQGTEEGDVENNAVRADAGELDNAFRHGLAITFEGDYLSTLAYMRELESLEWRFFWDNLEYEVIEYPRGLITFTLYTISLDKDWIGV